MPLFTTQRRVEFAETDMAGIVHFANFFVYFEQAEHELFRSLGLAIMDHQPDGSTISWPRVSASCSYDAPARYEDVIEIRLDDLKLGRSSLTMQWSIHREDTQLCTGELRTACCSIRTGEKMAAIAIPDNVRASFAGLEPA